MDNSLNLSFGGDINMNLLDPTSQWELIRLLKSNFCIKTITRIQNRSAALLDVFITIKDARKLLFGVTGAGISDQVFIFQTTY